MKKRILQKILLLIITSLISPMLFAQCGTIMVNSSQLQYPDTITNLPVANRGTTYQTIIQLFVPSSYMGNQVMSMTINSVNGLPNGFLSGFQPANGNIVANNSGCLIIQSPSVNANLGIYPIKINVTFNLVGSSVLPYQISGYYIKVDPFINRISTLTSNWYSLSDWVLQQTSSQSSYLCLIMKDSLAKIINSNNDTLYNDIISFGSVLDPSDPLIDYSLNPNIKVLPSDSVYLDSISFPYIYIRNTDSLQVASNKISVKDTLIITWYRRNNLTNYQFSGTPPRLFAMPPISGWSFANRMQTNFYRRDTILLSKTDTTSVTSNESNWTTRTINLKAPPGIYDGTNNLSKLIGFSVNFKSGVSNADNGVMIFQGNSTNTPNGLRPNYFGGMRVIDLNYELGSLVDNSRSCGLIATAWSSYPNNTSWAGYLPGVAFTSKQFIVSSFKVRRFRSIEWSVTDTNICKGGKVDFKLNNCQLFKDSILIGTGNLTLLPIQNSVFTIKSGGQLIRNVNITIYDSLNAQSITSLDTLKICGLNSKFAIGTTSSYTGIRNYKWYRNDTLLTNTLGIDSFVSPGNYKTIITTPTGCLYTDSFYVTKTNSSFNPNFSSNRQAATAPPFDFTFANQTQPLNDYNYIWNWGDGFIDSTNNQILFKNYSNNGQYTVKLTAQHKQTGCKDSITKVNYISCSGANPQPLSLTTTKNNPSCFGLSNGSISVNAAGGTLPYQYRVNAGSYQSSNTFSNLLAGIYTIDVKDAQNNVVTKKDTLTNPPAITVGGINGLNGVPVSSTQSYSIAAQSGASYSWSVINGTLLSGNGTNAIQVQWPVNSGIGKVSIIITKNNCNAFDSLLISIGANPLTALSSKQNESCIGKNDGSISITASGGNPPYMYSLNNGTYQTSNMFNALSGGIYTIRVKDNNQVVVTKFDTITSGVKPTAGIITGPTTVATLAMNNYIVGQQTGVNYLWNITGGVVASGQNTNVVQVAWGSQSMIGKVSVKVTNAGGCSDSSDLNVNVGSVGTNELSISNKVQIYPNPNNGSFAIDVLNSNIEQVDIFNSIGQLIWSYTSNETKQSVLEVRLKTTPGIYTVSVKTESGVVNQKLILTQ